MKIFLANDSDQCCSAYIGAEEIVNAAELYKKEYGFYPEIIKDITQDGVKFIIDDSLKSNDKP